MKKQFTYQYPRAAVTTDCVIFGVRENELKLLLVKRAIQPYKGKWALPGGFISMKETADECAQRLLKEEAGIRNVFIEQLYTFSNLKRDPRERVISIAYYALVNAGQLQPVAGHFNDAAAWHPVKKIPSLAFDHRHIAETALKRLQGKLVYQPIGFELLPRQFSVSQLHHLYETILERKLDRRNFTKKILSMKLLERVKEKRITGAPGKPATLFQFNKGKYHKLTTKGFSFQL
ncbi:MAG TPA: NUDIX domain-containing protein [Chitinophagales bacterium]|nr:NUDIX domain-containing protein [Chitinophagales bacterium]